MKMRYNIFCFFLFSFIHAQYIQVAPEIATAGAFLGGKLGTHAIHSNPALLGIKTGEFLERSLVDTFTVSYGVKLAQTTDKKELQEIKTRLIQDGFERDYKIDKIDSLLILSTKGFKDSFSAFNYSSNLPASIPLKTIYTDTLWTIIEKPKTIYSIQVLATPNQDTLKSFKRRFKKRLKELPTKVVFKDSLYKYYVGSFDSEEKAVMLKNNPTIQSIDNKSFIVSNYDKILEGTAPKFSFTFPFRFTLNMQNNSFNINWLNKYIGEDMIQDPSIKNDLISSIPSSGISSVLWLNTGLFDMTYKHYGLSLLNVNIFSSVNIPKELTQILFEGISFNEPQNISSFDSRGFVYNETKFSFGRKLDFKQLKSPIYVGFGLKYLNGLFSYIEKYDGVITTKEDSISIFSDLDVVYTDPNQIASGFGIDLGFYGHINDKVSAQLSIINLGSFLKSKQGTNWKSINRINLSSSDFSDILDYNDVQKDSISNTFSILDTTAYVEDVSIILPYRLNIATSYNFSNDIHFKAAVQYFAQTDFIGKVTPQISIGAEIFPRKSFSLLGGLSIGGMNKINIGSGLEIKIKNFCFYLAGSQYGGLYNSAKGFNVSSEFRFLF